MIYNTYNEPENDFDIRPSDIVPASYEALVAVSRGSWRAFTWNDRFEPLVIDAFTASAMVQVHDALSNQAKFERMVAASREAFGRLVDFTWKEVA